MAGNETEDGYDYYEDEEEFPVINAVFYGIIIPCLIVVCITGNILTVVAFAQDRRLRTVYNTYILSMAVADLLIGTISMPFYAAYTFTNFVWPFGRAFCKIWNSIDFMACLESVLIIMLVSYDRCMLLKQGAAYSVKQTHFAARVRIGLTWSLGFLLYVPAIIVWDHARGYSVLEDVDCDVEFYNNFPFIMVTSVFEFLIPLISISSLNTYLYVLIRDHSRRQPGSQKTSVEAEPATETTRKEPPSWKQINIHTISKPAIWNYVQKTKAAKNNDAIRRERKAARSLAVLVTVFAICWMPYTIATVIIAFCDIGCVNEEAYEAFNWILWAKSAFNPFLYAFTNERFRSNFKRILRLRSCHKQKSRVSPAENNTNETDY